MTQPAHPTPASKDFVVIAPAVSAEAIITNERGHLIACLSSVGRSREQVLSDARMLSFAGKLHGALGVSLDTQRDVAMQLGALAKGGLDAAGMAEAVLKLAQRLGAGVQAGRSVHAGATLRGEAATVFDDRQTGEDAEMTEARQELDRSEQEYQRARQVRTLPTPSAGQTLDGTGHAP